MGRTLLLATLAAAMLAVPAALAGDTPGDGTLSVKRGKGIITLKRFNGTVLGRINGTISVVDFTPYDDTDPHLIGCKVRHTPKLIGVVYACKSPPGKSVSFRLLDGKYRVSLNGIGIFLSAVGYGSGTVDGRGDLGVNDGVMSLNDQPYESLPDIATPIHIEAPPPQPGG